MEDDAVVVGLRDLLVRPGVRPFLRALGQPDKIRDGVRGFGIVEADGEIAFGRLELRVDRQRWLLLCTNVPGNVHPRISLPHATISPMSGALRTLEERSLDAVATGR